MERRAATRGAMKMAMFGSVFVKWRESEVAKPTMNEVCVNSQN
jgi:hypothetical protein